MGERGSYKKRHRERKGLLGQGGMFAWGRAGISFLTQKSKVPFFSASIAAWGLGQ